MEEGKEEERNAVHIPQYFSYSGNNTIKHKQYNFYFFNNLNSIFTVSKFYYVYVYD